jgi:hypothetical protein
VDENQAAAGGESTPKKPRFRVEFHAPDDQRLIAYGAADGTTRRLHAKDGVIVARSPEDAEYLSSVVGLKHAPKTDPTPAAGTASEKEA